MSRPKIRANTQDLMQAFNVAHMTIYNWRHGKGVEKPLPFEVNDPTALKPRVLFVPRAVKAWAAKCKIDFARPLDVVVSQGGQRKPPGRPKKRKDLH